MFISQPCKKRDREREGERGGEEKYILQLHFTNKKKMDTQIRQSKNNFDK